MIQQQFHDRLAADIRANHERLKALVRPLDPERLTRRPGPQRWSVGEVLEHLTLMDALFLTASEPLVRDARRDAAAPAREWKASFLGGMIASSLEGPRRLRSAKVGRPGMPRNGVTEAFLAGDMRYMQLLDDALTLDWNAVRMRPPVLPWLPIRINLGDVFAIHRVHVTRHIGQIERTIAAL